MSGAQVHALGEAEMVSSRPYMRNEELCEVKWKHEKGLNEAQISGLTLKNFGTSRVRTMHWTIGSRFQPAGLESLQKWIRIGVLRKCNVLVAFVVGFPLAGSVGYGFTKSPLEQIDPCDVANSKLLKLRH
ncbi:unnamed protein product, partial [Ilex paraguariensis]